MGWRDRRQRLVSLIKGALKGDIPLHDRVEEKHWDDRARPYEENWAETEAMYRNYKEYIGYSAAHRLYIRRVCQWSSGRGLVLDIGTGLGLDAVHFAARGARVVALDLSGRMLRLLARGARLHGLRVETVKASAHALPFGDGVFDVVAGSGVLHHLNLRVAAPELARVLRPGGRAVFVEPMMPPGPLLETRALLPVACHESPGGGAITREDLRFLQGAFGEMRVHRFYLFEFVCRISWMERWRMLVSCVDGIAAPFLGPVPRTGVIELRRAPREKERPGTQGDNI